jgi:hypothetical protein
LLDSRVFPSSKTAFLVGAGGVAGSYVEDVGDVGGDGERGEDDGGRFFRARVTAPGAEFPSPLPITPAPFTSGYWGVVINKRRQNKTTLNKTGRRIYYRRFCSAVAVYTVLFIRPPEGFFWAQGQEELHFVYCSM